jgi:hypothetical protein
MRNSLRWRRRIGEVGTARMDDKRHGTLSLFAALDAAAITYVYIHF